MDRHVMEDLAIVGEEAERLRTKYGPLRNEAEGMYHIGRAYRTLERTVDDKDAPPASKAEEMLHLAAVCIRAARAIPR